MAHWRLNYETIITESISQQMLNREVRVFFFYLSLLVQEK
jgi:hypothetical protein